MSVKVESAAAKGNSSLRKTLVWEELARFSYPTLRRLREGWGTLGHVVGKLGARDANSQADSWLVTKVISVLAGGVGGAYTP